MAHLQNEQDFVDYHTCKVKGNRIWMIYALMLENFAPKGRLPNAVNVMLDYVWAVI